MEKTNAYKEWRKSNPRQTAKPVDWRTRKLPFKAKRWAYQTRVKLEQKAELKWRGTTESWRLEERQAIACFRNLPSIAELESSIRKGMRESAQPSPTGRIIEEAASIPPSIFSKIGRAVGLLKP